MSLMSEAARDGKAPTMEGKESANEERSMRAKVKQCDYSELREGGS